MAVGPPEEGEVRRGACSGGLPGSQDGRARGPEGDHAFLKTTVCLPSGPTSGAQDELPALSGRMFACRSSACGLLHAFSAVVLF